MSNPKTIHLRGVTREAFDEFLAKASSRGYSLVPAGEATTGGIFSVVVSYEYDEGAQQLTLVGVRKPGVFSWTDLMNQVFTHATEDGLVEKRKAETRSDYGEE